MATEIEHYPVPVIWFGKEDWSCNCGDKNCASLVDHPMFNKPGGIEADKRVVHTYFNENRDCSSVLFIHDNGNHEIVCSCKGSYLWTIRSSTVPNLREANNG